MTPHTARVVSAAGERMATVTLTEFLLARIAEDEAAARQARPGLAWDELAFHDLAADDVPHIARHSPARVLAECEAKRRIVRLHAPDDEGFHICHDSLADDSDCGELRALAAVYADHRGYREEWKP